MKTIDLTLKIRGTEKHAHGEHNLLLITRYSTFKSLLVSSNAINDSNKDKFPNLYYLLYEEDLVGGGNTIKESSLK